MFWSETKPFLNRECSRKYHLKVLVIFCFRKWQKNNSKGKLSITRLGHATRLFVNMATAAFRRSNCKPKFFLFSTSL